LNLKDSLETAGSDSLPMYIQGLSLLAVHVLAALDGGGVPGKGRKSPRAKRCRILNCELSAMLIALARYKSCCFGFMDPLARFGLNTAVKTLMVRKDDREGSCVFSKSDRFVKQLQY
jgi:hypothetical protein